VKSLLLQSSEFVQYFGECDAHPVIGGRLLYGISFSSPSKERTLHFPNRVAHKAHGNLNLNFDSDSGEYLNLKITLKVRDDIGKKLQLCRYPKAAYQR
jgi:hypothetical protein